MLQYGAFLRGLLQVKAMYIVLGGCNAHFTVLFTEY